MTELKGVNSENIFELVSESRIGIDRIAVERGRVCLVLQQYSPELEISVAQVVRKFCVALAAKGARPVRDTAAPPRECQLCLPCDPFHVTR